MTPAARVLTLLVRAYRVVSKPFPSPCRFAPTCSEYALQALATHGAARGSWLAVRRIARCHPFNPGGLDPVPGRTPSADGTPGPVPAAKRSAAA